MNCNARPTSHHQKRPRHLAVATPKAFDRCETFIHDQIAALPRQVSVLWGDDFPRYWGDRPLLARRGLSWAWQAVARRLITVPPEQWPEHVLAHQLRREKVDVLIAHYGPTGTAVAGACERAGVPLIVHFHGYDAYQYETLRIHGHRYQKMFQQAAAVVAVSEHMVDQLVMLGCERHKIHHVAYGIDLGRFMPTNPARNDASFLSVGRFVDKKAPHLLLLAFAQALAQCPSLRLRMIGDGPLLGASRSLAKALRVEHAVTFTGALPREDVAAAMSTTRAFVQHSIRPASGDGEGTPVAMLEAMACGLPVIATRHHGIAETIRHGMSGLLVDEADITGMACQMVALAQSPETAHRLGMAGRADVQSHHSGPEQIAALRALVDSVVAGQASPMTSQADQRHAAA